MNAHQIECCVVILKAFREMFDLSVWDIDINPPLKTQWREGKFSVRIRLKGCGNGAAYCRGIDPEDAAVEFDRFRTSMLLSMGIKPQQIEEPQEPCYDEVLGQL